MSEQQSHDTRFARYTCIHITPWSFRFAIYPLLNNTEYIQIYIYSVADFCLQYLDVVIDRVKTSRFHGCHTIV